MSLAHDAAREHLAAARMWIEAAERRARGDTLETAGRHAGIRAELGRALREIAGAQVAVEEMEEGAVRDAERHLELMRERDGEG